MVILRPAHHPSVRRGVKRRCDDSRHGQEIMEMRFLPPLTALLIILYCRLKPITHGE